MVYSCQNGYLARSPAGVPYCVCYQGYDGPYCQRRTDLVSGIWSGFMDGLSKIIWGPSDDHQPPVQSQRRPYFATLTTTTYRPQSVPLFVQQQQQQLQKLHRTLAYASSSTSSVANTQGTISPTTPSGSLVEEPMVQSAVINGFICAMIFTFCALLIFGFCYWKLSKKRRRNAACEVTVVEVASVRTVAALQQPSNPVQPSSIQSSVCEHVDANPPTYEEATGEQIGKK